MAEGVTLRLLEWDVAGLPERGVIGLSEGGGVARLLWDGGVAGLLEVFLLRDGDGGVAELLEGCLLRAGDGGVAEVSERRLAGLWTGDGGVAELLEGCLLRDGDGGVAELLEGTLLRAGDGGVAGLSERCVAGFLDGGVSGPLDIEGGYPDPVGVAASRSS